MTDQPDPTGPGAAAPPGGADITVPDLDQIVHDESRTFAERNRARAYRAALRLRPASTGASADLPDRDAIIAALVDELHCGEGTGAFIDELITDALRAYWRDVEAEERELQAWRSEIWTWCRHCGQRRQEPHRWFEPCSSCRFRVQQRDSRISDDPVVANEQRGHLVEETLDAFAARTGQGAPLAYADNEVRAEVLRDFVCNAGHWADGWGGDLDQLLADAQAIYRDERADAECDDTRDDDAAAEVGA
ncbi:hypothetical protein AB0A73_22120 [Glycomyces sp. NPDC047369]